MQKILNQILRDILLICVGILAFFTVLIAILFFFQSLFGFTTALWNSFYNYVLPTIALILAFKVIRSQNVLRSLLSLIGLFLILVFFLILLKFEFLAFTFLIVYVGAVAVLFLFVVMLFNIKGEKHSHRDNLNLKSKVRFRKIVVRLFVLLSCYVAIIKLCLLIKLQFITITAISFSKLLADNIAILNFNTATNNDILVFGYHLYNFYFFLFILIGFILFFSMIGAVVLVLGFTTKQKEVSVFEVINTLDKKPVSQALWKSNVTIVTRTPLDGLGKKLGE